MAEKDEETVEKMFDALYDESVDYIPRIHNFRESAKLLVEKHKEKNELEKSKLYAENYYLYHVYQFDTKTVKGEYSIRKGSLEDLCLMSQTYRVEFKGN